MDWKKRCCQSRFPRDFLNVDLVFHFLLQWVGKKTVFERKHCLSLLRTSMRCHRGQERKKSRGLALIFSCCLCAFKCRLCDKTPERIFLRLQLCVAANRCQFLSARLCIEATRRRGGGDISHLSSDTGGEGVLIPLSFFKR